ncbi:MFS transporter [Alkalicoccus chagannorensis]|uniref:MFS transporter n=1 Tax=Alkalicoccus chagannorensis TaxID=427072 RepID=UPI0003F76DE7|nr:MFS transporter [Alkalicoccus chagannorensis]
MPTHQNEQYASLQKKILFVTAAAQMFGGAGLAAGIATGALLAEEMFASDYVIGIPSALFTLGSALAAWFIGSISQKAGRRKGLAAGFAAGAAGSLLVIAGSAFHLVPVLFAGLFIYGAGTAANLQARYAGTDLALPARRGRAISIVLAATTAGAVLGPAAVDVTEPLTRVMGLSPLTGPFILAAAAFSAASVILFTWLKPDPFLTAGAMEKEKQDTGTGTISRRVLTAGTMIIVISQLVMVALMTMTPVHMDHHGHSLSQIGIVIGLHIGAMYLPSPISGWLTDTWGRAKTAAAGGGILFISGIVSAAAPGGSFFWMAAALVLLGLGWNFGFVSGTAYIIDAVPQQLRASMQGRADIFTALAGTAGGAASGMVLGASSFAVLSIAGGILSLLIIPAAFRHLPRV